MGFLILTLTTPSVLAAAALGCTGQGSSSSPVPLPEAALKPAAVLRVMVILFQLLQCKMGAAS